MRRRRTTGTHLGPERTANQGTGTTSASEKLATHLRDIIAQAEEELARLGRYPQAWQQVRMHLRLAHPPGTAPTFAWGPMADTLLGPIAPPSDRLIPTRKIEALPDIRRRATRCRRCQRAIAAVPKWNVESAMIAQARDHHPDLYRKYQREVSRPMVVLEAPAWAAALRAAAAAAALQHLASPVACFTAGAYLEQHRLLAWAEQTLLPQARVQARRRFQEGIARGQFPALERKIRERVWSEAAKQQQAERAMESEPVRDAVRQEYRRLREAGVRVTRAMRQIVEDPDVHQRIQRIARDLDVAPWHGSFYSFAGVRKIVGVEPRQRAYPGKRARRAAPPKRKARDKRGT